MITKVRRVYFRSSHPVLFCKFTGKRLCQSPATLLKKRLRYRCFPVNFAIFLRILLFFYRTLPVAASAFFTSPPSVHYFLMFQFSTNNSVKNIGIIFLYYVYFVYFSVDIQLKLILGVFLCMNYRPFSIFSYGKKWYKFS